MRNIFLEQGYVIYKNFLSKNFIEEHRSILDNYLDKHTSFREDQNSRIIPGFAGITPELKELNNFHENSSLLDILKIIFDDAKIIHCHFATWSYWMHFRSTSAPAKSFSTI